MHGVGLRILCVNGQRQLAEACSIVLTLLGERAEKVLGSRLTRGGVIERHDFQ